MDSVLTLLGLALRAGKLAVGEEPVREALVQGQAKAVFLAADAAEHTRRKIVPRLEDVPLRILPAPKEALGRALGRASCALCAVTDKGFAKSLSDRLAQAEAASANHDGGVTL